MIYTDLEQQSPDWFAMRVGAVTGSRVCDVLAKLKDPKKEAAPRTNYREELVIERLTGLTYEHYVSKYMDNGVLNEPLARTEYELRFGHDCQPVGLALHPTIKWFMASPDSLVGDDGLLEIKCLQRVTQPTHLSLFRANEIPEEFHWQMYAEMACAEREWCDFVSFSPHLPKHLQLFCKRFYRDDKLIRGMEAEVVTFLEQVEAMLEQLKKFEIAST